MYFHKDEIKEKKMIIRSIGLQTLKWGELICGVGDIAGWREK